MAHKNWLIILLERNLGSILPIVCILLVRHYTSTLVNMCVTIMHTVCMHMLCSRWMVLLQEAGKGSVSTR